MICHDITLQYVCDDRLAGAAVALRRVRVRETEWVTMTAHGHTTATGARSGI